MDLTTLVLFQLLNGLVWGLVIALIALGLALIFGIMEVINVAHGSLYMLGAVLAWYVFGATESFAAAVLIAPVAVGALTSASAAGRWRVGRAGRRARRQRPRSPRCSRSGSR